MKLKEVIGWICFVFILNFSCWFGISYLYSFNLVNSFYFGLFISLLVGIPFTIVILVQMKSNKLKEDSKDAYTS